MSSGRGFDSRQVHHKHISVRESFSRYWVTPIRSSVFLMGLTWSRQGKEYMHGQSGNVKAVGLG